MTHVFALVLALVMSAPTLANYNRPPSKDAFDAALLRIDEGRYLGQKVPDVSVQTEAGTQRLYDLMADRPTILLLAYYTCYGACLTTIQNTVHTLRSVSDPEYRVLVLSFDANDTLASLRHAKSTLDDATPDHWTFGLLSREEAERLTGSVGFKFFFSERDRTFVHPSVLVFLSPQAEVMRYLYGTEPRSDDIELALIESRGRVQRLNEWVDMLKLTCYRYDPAHSRYALHPTLIFGGIGLGVLGMTGLVALAYKRDPRYN
jgi:protein SCO1/2